MKVVLFCGGMGLRLRDFAEHTPKPMVIIGDRPILWHVMKYYAHFGHRDFILCLGYRADTIKQYFLNYNEFLSNDFEFSQGGKQLRLANSDIQDWKISFVDTGLTSNVGQRLRAVRDLVQDDEMFLANYTDGLTYLHCPDLLEFAEKQDKVATFVSVRPNLSYHVIRASSSGLVTEIKELSHSDIRINGGLFVFKRNIFDYLHEGEELVLEPFRRLMAEEQLVAYEYHGFFGAMDTFKDKQRLDDLYESGKAPWQVWRKAVSVTAAASELAEGVPSVKLRKVSLRERDA
jgi:glucose-1-phosphate cytidylyltransferase